MSTIPALSNTTKGVLKMTSLDEITKQIKTLVAENKRLSGLKERYIEIADKLDKIGDDLKSLARDIDPMKSVSRSYSSRVDYTDKLESLYSMLQKGTQLTRAKISAIYPDLDYNNVSHILNKLKGMNHVNTAKDGNEIRLFYHRGVNI